MFTALPEAALSSARSAHRIETEVADSDSVQGDGTGKKLDLQERRRAQSRRAAQHRRMAGVKRIRLEIPKVHELVVSSLIQSFLDGLKAGCLPRLGEWHKPVETLSQVPAAHPPVPSQPQPFAKERAASKEIAFWPSGSDVARPARSIVDSLPLDLLSQERTSVDEKNSPLLEDIRAADRVAQLGRTRA